METMAVTKRSRQTKGKKRPVYQAEVWVQGVRVESRQFDTQAAAYAWHDDTKKKYEENPSGGSSQVRQMTFGVCLQKYACSSDFNSLRLSSQQSRSVRFKHFERSPLSDIEMSDLRADHIDEWLMWLRKTPTALNAGRKTFNHELTLLTVILNWYRNEIHPGFEVPVVKRHREKARYKEVSPRRADYFIQTSDIQIWLETLKKGRNKPYFYLAQFLVLTGARLGEAAGLMWDCVDLERKHATIRRTAAWDHSTRVPYLQEQAKNVESIRLIRLPPLLVEMLSEMKTSSQSPVVFCDRSHGLLRDNGIRSAFNRAFKANNLPWTATRYSVTLLRLGT